MSMVIDVAFPVFGIILIGFVAGKAGILGRASSEALNAFVYWLALPPLLFLGLGSMPLTDVLRWHFIGAFAGSALAVWLIGGVIGWLIHRERGDAVSMQGMCASFSNTGYMGLPLFAAAFGETGLAPAMIGTVVMAALSIGIAVILLELTSAEGHGILVGLGKVVLALVKNPLVVSSAAGIAWSALAWPLPEPVETLFSLVGAAASPCALVAIGLFMASQKLGESIWEVSWISALKLIWQPIICWILAVTLFPMDPFWQASAVLLAALPTGALVFVVAQRYGTYVERSSAIVLVSTVVSVLSLSLLLTFYAPLIALGPPV